MPLCREAVLGPGVYAGFAPPAIPDRYDRPARRLWRRDGGPIVTVRDGRRSEPGVNARA